MKTIKMLAIMLTAVLLVSCSNEDGPEWNGEQINGNIPQNGLNRDREHGWFFHTLGECTNEESDICGGPMIRFLFQSKDMPDYHIQLTYHMIDWEYILPDKNQECFLDGYTDYDEAVTKDLNRLEGLKSQEGNIYIGTPFDVTANGLDLTVGFIRPDVDGDLVENDLISDGKGKLLAVCVLPEEQKKFPLDESWFQRDQYLTAANADVSAAIVGNQLLCRIGENKSAYGRNIVALIALDEKWTDGDSNPHFLGHPIIEVTLHQLGWGATK